MTRRPLGAAPDPYRDRVKHDHVASVVAELLLISLPFVVLFIVFAAKGTLIHVIVHPEWAIAASILSGQSVVRLVSPVIKDRFRNVIADNVTLFIAAVIVVVLVPSLTVLSLILTSEKPSIPLGITQVVLAVLSGVVYFVVAMLDDPIHQQPEQRRPRTKSTTEEA